MTVLCLTSTQQTVVTRAVGALRAEDQDPFLRAVGFRLRSERKVSDASVRRIVRDVLAVGCYRARPASPESLDGRINR
jgi:hypothetical protein